MATTAIMRVPLTARVNGTDVQVGEIIFDLAAEPQPRFNDEGLRLASQLAEPVLKALPGGS